MEKLDALDFKIIDELSKDGRISVTNLASKVKSSRPTVTSRLNRLIETGTLNIKGGINLKKVNYKMATVGLEIKTESSRKKVLDLLIACPRVQTIFRTPSKSNIEVGIWGENEQTVNSTIESFRDFPNVEIVSSNYLGSPVHGSITINMMLGNQVDAPCSKFCGDCHRYTSEWCNGCPSTKFYRNPIV